MAFSDNLDLSMWYTLPEALNGKTILPAYKFKADFENNTNDNNKQKMLDRIKPWHFVSVSVPTYTFRREVVKYGAIPRTFPILDFNEGLTVRVTLEEDNTGTIAYFVNWCQRQNIDNYGFYVAPLLNRIGDLRIEMQDNVGEPIVHYVFKNLYYEDASELALDYGSTDVIKYDIRFTADVVEVNFYKQVDIG